jgi:hypothetical protein
MYTVKIPQMGHASEKITYSNENSIFFIYILMKRVFF